MKRYFKNRSGRLIELAISSAFSNGELQRVNIFLIQNGESKFIHTLFFSRQVMLDYYQLVELGDPDTDLLITDCHDEIPFYLFCSPLEISDFNKTYPRVILLREEYTLSNLGHFA